MQSNFDQQMADSFSSYDTETRHTNPHLLNGILSRRSIHPKRLIDPGPGSDEIQQIAASASTAADHCGLNPWRLLAITGDARAELGEIFAEIKVHRDPDISAIELERERDRARAVPVLLAIISRMVEGHPIVPVKEQYACIGAAIQNILLCADGMGYGAKMVSGRKIKDQRLARAFNLTSVEAVFGFVCLGTMQTNAVIKPRVVRSDIVTNWTKATSTKPVGQLLASGN